MMMEMIVASVGVLLVFMVSLIISMVLVKGKSKKKEKTMFFTGKLENTDLSISKATDYLKHTDSFIKYSRENNLD